MKYFEVTFCYTPGLYCANIVHAPSSVEVAKHYSKYTWVKITEVIPETLESTLRLARRKGMPIFTILEGATA